MEWTKATLLFWPWYSFLSIAAACMTWSSKNLMFEKLIPYFIDSKTLIFLTFYHPEIGILWLMTSYNCCRPGRNHDIVVRTWKGPASKLVEWVLAVGRKPGAQQWNTFFFNLLGTKWLSRQGGKGGVRILSKAGDKNRSALYNCKAICN